MDTKIFKMFFQIYLIRSMYVPKITWSLFWSQVRMGLQVSIKVNLTRGDKVTGERIGYWPSIPQ